MSEYHYIMMNKPRGCITACKDEKHKTVMEYLPSEFRSILRPVGRLDKDTEGLLLFTNDGHFNQKLMHPEHHIPKTYFFWALGTLDEHKKEQLTQGVLLRGCSEPTAPALLNIKETAEISDIRSLINPDQQPGILKNPTNTSVVSGLLTITEGKKHQVKRMLKAVGCYVVYLKRISVGNLFLDASLCPGTYRALTADEYHSLLNFSYNELDIPDNSNFPEMHLRNS